VAQEERLKPVAILADPGDVDTVSDDVGGWPFGDVANEPSFALSHFSTARPMPPRPLESGDLMAVNR
jgi:hypothetical protein